MCPAQGSHTETEERGIQVLNSQKLQTGAAWNYGGVTKTVGSFRAEATPLTLCPKPGLMLGSVDGWMDRRLVDGWKVERWVGGWVNELMKKL